MKQHVVSIPDFGAFENVFLRFRIIDCAEEAGGNKKVLALFR